MIKYKIVFVSNFYNHHQKYLSDAFYNLIGDNYCFIETQPISNERLNMGWGESKVPNYVKQNYISGKANEECQKLIDDADIVIIGSAPDVLIKNRIKSGKLIFRYSERPFKERSTFRNYTRRFLSFHHHNPFYAKNYMLCASAYTAADFNSISLFRRKCYKWGYFPETKKYDDINNIINYKKKYSILWAGRLLEWKHPDSAIRVAKKLKESSRDFELNIIGTGPMEQELIKMISDYGLENEVHMLGSMKPEQVREHMEQSQIYLFTSDRNEGWGAVLNESMNSVCAVVASHAIGSVPFLLKDGKNGLIYKDGDEEDLCQKVKLLLDNPDLCRKYGRQAYLTMADEWNAETATKRFIVLAESILSGNKRPYLFTNGPCSKADVLKDTWYKDN